MSSTTIVVILMAGTALGIAPAVALLGPRRTVSHTPDAADRATWRMPPLAELAPPRLTPTTRIWMVILRAYLVVAGGLVLVRIAQLAGRGLDH